MGKCSTPCLKTASINGPAGNRIMISQQGNTKFPAGTPHPQCDSCLKEEVAELEAMKAALVIGDAALADRYLASKKKFNL